MGIFDKISKMCEEEKRRAIRAHEQSKNAGRKSPEENVYNHFMNTLEEATGIKRENIVSMKVDKIKTSKKY